MTDWKKKQAECNRCRGVGFVNSAARHADGSKRPAWASLCQCQPRTMQELAEAAAQEPKQ